MINTFVCNDYINIMLNAFEIVLIDELFVDHFEVHSPSKK
jgi:hypothetical protein